MPEFGGDFGWEVTLGELDGDGSLDALVTEGTAKRVWLNEVYPFDLYLPVLVK